jgi:hypothetical protein
MLALVFSIGLLSAPIAQHAAIAQSSHRSWAHKHKTLTSVAAGVAAYKAAKITGNNRAAMGGRKNFMQRHPVLTGMGAAMATHHMLKKTDHH